jgi:hypothetical protein
MLLKAAFLTRREAKAKVRWQRRAKEEDVMQPLATSPRVVARAA